MIKGKVQTMLERAEDIQRSEFTIPVLKGMNVFLNFSVVCYRGECQKIETQAELRTNVYSSSDGLLRLN